MQEWYNDCPKIIEENIKDHREWINAGMPLRQKTESKTSHHDSYEEQRERAKIDAGIVNMNIFFIP